MSVSEQFVEMLDQVYLPLLRALVDSPDRLSLEYEWGDVTLIVRVVVDKPDFGKILGKDGKTINALRTILYRLSGKNGVRTVLEVVE